MGRHFYKIYSNSIICICEGSFQLRNFLIISLIMGLSDCIFVFQNLKLCRTNVLRRSTYIMTRCRCTGNFEGDVTQVAECKSPNQKCNYILYCYYLFVSCCKQFVNHLERARLVWSLHLLLYSRRILLIIHRGMAVLSTILCFPTDHSYRGERANCDFRSDSQRYGRRQPRIATCPRNSKTTKTNRATTSERQEGAVERDCRWYRFFAIF